MRFWISLSTKDCPTVPKRKRTIFCKASASSVLPNPQFRRPIGLLLTFSPRPAKPYRYFWATFDFLATKCLEIGHLCEKLSISCQFRLILILFNVNEQIYHQLIGLRCYTEPSKVIILNFRSWIIYRFSTQLGDFWLIWHIKTPKIRHLGAFLLDEILGYF